MKRIVLLLSGISIFALGCGIKGPPQPPAKEETIQGQKNWDEIEKTTQPTPVIPKPKKGQPKKKTPPNEN